MCSLWVLIRDRSRASMVQGGEVNASKRALRLMSSKLRRGPHVIGEALPKVNFVVKCLVDFCSAYVL